MIARHQLSPISPYRGVLVSDCLSISDDLTPLQQKCYAHHLKKIGEALAGPAAGSAFLADLRGLLSGAMALKAAMPGLPAGRVVAMRAALDANAERLLGTPRAPGPRNGSGRGSPSSAITSSPFSIIQQSTPPTTSPSASSAPP